jgi:hypothetical protein
LPDNRKASVLALLLQHRTWQACLFATFSASPSRPETALWQNSCYLLKHKASVQIAQKLPSKCCWLAAWRGRNMLDVHASGLRYRICRTAKKFFAPFACSNKFCKKLVLPG